MVSFRVMIQFLALGVLTVCQADDPEKATESYRRAIELDPDDAVAHVNLGLALGKQGKLDEAIESFRRAIELDSNDADAHYNLGVILADQGKLDEAIQSHRRAIELDPKEAKAHNSIGYALDEQGKTDEAIESFRRAIEIDPEYAKAHYNLGAAWLQQGKLDEAIESFRRAIEIDPKNAMAHTNLGIALHQQGNAEEAIESYRRAIELDPDFFQAHNSLGYALFLQGKMDEAIESYRRAIELGPKNLLAIANLAMVYAKLDQIDLCGIWCARRGLANGLTAEAMLAGHIRQGFRLLKVEVPVEEPTDQAVRAYYEANKETLSGVAVHLRTLAIPKSKRTREFVDELRAKLVAGGDFAAAAKKYSYDLASTKGGDHGWVKRGDLRQDLIDAAFALKAGEFSEVIEDGNIFRILNTVEHRDGSLVPLEKVREQIVAKLINEAPAKLIREAQAKRIQGWIEQARKEHAEAMDGA